jgi:acyl carrier protein
MTEAEVFAKLTDIFRNVFDDETLVAHANMTAKEVDRWDSLSHIDMIVLVEEAFRIRIRTSEIAHLMNVGDLVRLILSRVQ